MTKCIHHMSIFPRLYYFIIRRLIPCSRCGTAVNANSQYCHKCKESLPTSLLCRIGIHHFKTVTSVEINSHNTWTYEEGKRRCSHCCMEIDYEKWRDPDVGYIGEDRFWSSLAYTFDMNSYCRQRKQALMRSKARRIRNSEIWHRSSKKGGKSGKS